MMYVILDPALEEARLVDAEILAGSDTDGCTVLDVEDDFAWDGLTVDWSTLTITEDLAAARSAKLAEISAEFERQVGLGCNSPKGWVDCDDKAQGRIANMISLRKEAAALSMVLDPTVDWTMFDKSQVSHDDAELVALGLAIGFGFAAKFKCKQALEATALDGSLTTRAEIAVIDVMADWP